jgi:putative hydrolase of the HAD superfamily
MTRPAFIALDLDDTMYGYATCHAAATEAAELAIADRYSLQLETIKEVFAKSRLATKKRLGSAAASHSRLLYFKLTLENLGLANHLDFALQLEATYWGTFIRKMVRAPGLTELLELCRQEAIPVFVMTDLTAQIQIRKLSRLQVLDHISGLVTSEEVLEDKPAGDFFGYAQEHLGLPDGRGWVIGDDVAKDGGLAQSSGNDFLLVGKQLDRSPSLIAVHKKLVAACTIR